jgi:ferric-dicitrate binding protein FerR (iron transport regulator)
MDDQFDLEFHISNLITRRIEGNLSDEEEQYLFNWAAESKENASLLKRLLASPDKDYLIKKELRQNIHKDKGWTRVQSKIRGRSRNRKIVLFMQATAAVFTIFLLSHYLFSTYPKTRTNNTEYQQTVLITGDGEIHPLADTTATFTDPAFLKNNVSHLTPFKKQKKRLLTQSSIPDTIIVPKGATYKFTLMDGTKVWLNANSRLVFPARFDEDTRQVSLSGEAFFQVASNPDIPFSIDVNGTEVRVIGTAFNINAYGDKDQMVTTVVEGKVLVSDAVLKLKEPLLPNEQLRISTLTGRVQKKTIETDIYTAWIHGRLVFENENLESLMKRLERLYNVKITISNNVDKTLKFTGDIKKYNDLNTVLDMLETTQNVHFSMNEHGVTVSK